MAFKLVAKDCPPLYAKLTSSHARRGAFAGRHVWVTQHSDAEFFPAGRFPLEAGADDGIADWTKQACTSSWFRPSLPYLAAYSPPLVLTALVVMWEVWSDRARETKGLGGLYIVDSGSAGMAFHAND